MFLVHIQADTMTQQTHKPHRIAERLDFSVGRFAQNAVRAQ